MMRGGKLSRCLIALLFTAFALNLAVATEVTVDAGVALETDVGEAPQISVDLDAVTELDEPLTLDDIPESLDIVDLDGLADLEGLDGLSDLDGLESLDQLDDLLDSLPGYDLTPEYDMDVVKAYLAAHLSSNTSGYRELQSLAGAWDKKHREYLDGEKEYRQGVAKYKEGKKAYEKGLAEYQKGKEKYDEGMKQYKDGTEQLKKGASALKEAKEKRGEGQEKLEDGETKYKENLAKYEDGVKKQSEAKAQADKLPENRWIITNCRGNSSFVQLMLGSSNLASLEMTFSLMFVLVGALVIYATISKMIDEQRNLVGAGKALGLFNREIFAKYLLFGMTGTVMGTLLGILMARFVMEVYVLNSARSYYTFDTSKPALIILPTVVALAAGGLLSLSATWFACNKLMRSTAIQLMQPKVPAGRKKTSSGKHVLPLYSRLILLNIRSDLRRVIVTIVSVAGCCALVVIGFTLKSAVEGAVQKQYAMVVNYDGRIKFDASASENAVAEIRKQLDSSGVEYTQFRDEVFTFRIKDVLMGELICGEIGQIRSFYNLLDWKTGEPLVASDDGILIQKRTAETYGLKVGSELELMLGFNNRAKVRVAGIFDNYIGRVMLMSRGYYRNLFGEDCVDNQMFIRLNGADEAKLLEALGKINGYDGYSQAESEKGVFASTSTLVTAIVALFIFMAAVMAGVVLTNLTNTYILQKKPELTIMRINGFTVREVIAYVTRETVFTTLVGIVAGIAMGAVIAYRITRALETSFVQYNRSVSLPAWAFGALITVLFTIVINVIVLRKVKRLKLTDMN